MISVRASLREVCRNGGGSRQQVSGGIMEQVFAATGLATGRSPNPISALCLIRIR